MAKKTHVKVRMVPEAKPDSPYFYYVKKPAGGEKAKNFQQKNTIRILENTKCLWKKSFHHIVSNYFFLKFLFS